VIETLSAGFDLVRRKPWLVVVPVVLDIGLWIAPKLSVASLMHNLTRQLLTVAAASPQALGSLQESTKLLEQMAETIDLSALVSSSFLGMPSLPVLGTTSFFGLTKRIIEVQGGLGLVGLTIGLSLVGLLIGALYVGLIAQEVREGRADWSRLGRRLPRYWLRLIGASLVTLGLFIFLGFPVGLMLGIFALFSQGLASLAMALFSVGLLWLMIYLAFVPIAILFGEDGVLAAVVHSITVVRTSLWSTLGLFVLINVITAGLVFIWQRLTASPAGALMAIVGNAFVGTGLTAAVIIFYRDRLQAWQLALKGERGEV